MCYCINTKYAVPYTELEIRMNTLKKMYRSFDKRLAAFHAWRREKCPGEERIQWTSPEGPKRLFWALVAGTGLTILPLMVGALLLLLGIFHREYPFWLVIPGVFIFYIFALRFPPKKESP
jgi:hypothetical protein